MQVLTKKLKGTTLVEVLVALAIMSFCAAMATVIYLNVQKSSLPFCKIKAVELAERYMKKTLSESSFYEETFKAEEFSVKKTIAVHALFGDCYVIRLVVFDGSKKKLVELESIIYNGE